MILNQDIGLRVRNQPTRCDRSVDGAKRKKLHIIRFFNCGGPIIRLHFRRRGRGSDGNVNQARRSLQPGHSQQDLIELLAGDHRGAGAHRRRESHLKKLSIDLLKKRLIPRDCLRITRVAHHPLHDLGTVLEQLVGEVAVDQLRHLHVLRLDDVEIVAQLLG